MSKPHVDNLPPTTNFMFVNITQPQDIRSRKTQKKINSHVMKPFGLARRCHLSNETISTTLPSPKSERNRFERLNDSKVTFTMPSIHSDNRNEPSLSPIPRHCLRLIPFHYTGPKSRPYPISVRTSKILHFLAVAQEAPVCKLMRELCFSLAFVDDSAFHLVLARLEIDPEMTGGKEPHEKANTLLHYDASVKNLRNQLESPQLKVHEGIIGVIINLACYDLFTNNPRRWQTHMSGLYNMVQYRGGIDTLTSRSLQVTATWVDLIGSMVLDQAPHFPSHQQDSLEFHCEQCDEVLGSPSVAQKCKANITMVFRMLSKLSILASGRSEIELSQDDHLLAALQGTIHTVLSLPRYDSPSTKDVMEEPCLRTYEILRLAVLLYLSGPATFLAGNRRFNLVTPHHRGQLSKLYSVQGVLFSVPEDLKLFVLVVGAMVEVQDDRLLFINHLSRVMLIRNMDWENLMNDLRSIAWFDIVWSTDLDRLWGDLAVDNDGGRKDKCESA